RKIGKPSARQRLVIASPPRSRNGLDPKNLQRAAQRNRSELRQSSCASHDFCDANMAMDRAWRDLIGTEINADDEEQTALWNTAWESARLRHIRASMTQSVIRP